MHLFEWKQTFLIVRYKKYEKKQLKCLNSSFFLDPKSSRRVKTQWILVLEMSLEIFMIVWPNE